MNRKRIEFAEVCVYVVVVLVMLLLCYGIVVHVGYGSASDAISVLLRTSVTI